MNPFLETKKNELIAMRNSLKLEDNYDLKEDIKSKLSTTIESDLAWAKEYKLSLEKIYKKIWINMTGTAFEINDEIRDLQEYIKWLEENK